jgi:hypothetical protein
VASLAGLGNGPAEIEPLVEQDAMAKDAGAASVMKT